VAMSTCSQMHSAGGERSPLAHRSAVCQRLAISQASPGPNSLIVSLVGLTAAGWVGALWQRWRCSPHLPC
jgi:hypothetical protein